jgi:hypothetical protein
MKLFKFIPLVLGIIVGAYAIITVLFRLWWGFCVTRMFPKAVEQGLIVAVPGFWVSAVFLIGLVIFGALLYGSKS